MIFSIMCGFVLILIMLYLFCGLIWCFKFVKVRIPIKLCYCFSKKAVSILLLRSPHGSYPEQQCLEGVYKTSYRHHITLTHLHFIAFPWYGLTLYLSIYFCIKLPWLNVACDLRILCLFYYIISHYTTSWLIWKLGCLWDMGYGYGLVSKTYSVTLLVAWYTHNYTLLPMVSQIISWTWWLSLIYYVSESPL